MSRLPVTSWVSNGSCRRLPCDIAHAYPMMSPAFPGTLFGQFSGTTRSVCTPSSSPPSPSSPSRSSLPLLCPRPSRPRSNTTSRHLSRVRPSTLPPFPYHPSPRPPVHSSPPPAPFSHRPPSLPPLSYPPSRPASPATFAPPVTPLFTESHPLAPPHCATPNPKNIEHPRSSGMLIMFERN